MKLHHNVWRGVVRPQGLCSVENISTPNQTSALCPAGKHPQHALVQRGRRHGEPLPQRPVAPTGRRDSIKTKPLHNIITSIKDKMLLSICQINTNIHYDITLKKSFLLTFPGLLRLSDPTDDCQLCGSVWVQRWGVQRAWWKYQVRRKSLTQLVALLRKMFLSIKQLCISKKNPLNQSFNFFLLILSTHNLIDCNTHYMCI